MSYRITKLALLSLTLALGTTSASANSYPKEMEKELIAVCKAVKSDSRLRLNFAVKATGLSMRDLHKGLVCNGEDMLAFASTHGATKTGALIAKRVKIAPDVLTAKR
ncbi:DUF3718 domain-containing protein [Alteromonas sp. D210916BOD_24]|uniref:DUF3718 domain-containing protein n=1 Tax=Alteromonas sp. D210916BOD_24 TaxID=3157618 RepID=UPI00399CC5BC